MKHELRLTMETGELTRLDKLAAAQGLPVEEVARGILLQAAYGVELTPQDCEAVRKRESPRLRRVVIDLDTADEYRLEKYALGAEWTLEAAAHALLSLQLGKLCLTREDYAVMAQRQQEKERQLEQDSQK